MTLRIAGVVATMAVALVAGALAFLGLSRGDLALSSLPANLPMLQLDFGVSLLAVPFLALLAMLAIAVGAWSLGRGGASDAALIAAFAAAMLAVLTARSVAAFFLAWEAMSLVSAFLVAAHHDERGVRRATFVYLGMAQTGALCILAALILLALASGSPEFGAIARAAPSLDPSVRGAVFALALVGFGSKAGLMPLHFWLPLAHPVAPANASAMLSGAMLKVALYGLCVVVFELAAPAPSSWGVTLVVLGAISSVGGVLYALVDHDLKRLLAYHSVENVGIIAIGLGVALTAGAAANGAACGPGAHGGPVPHDQSRRIQRAPLLGSGDRARHRGHRRSGAPRRTLGSPGVDCAALLDRLRRDHRTARRSTDSSPNG